MTSVGLQPAERFEWERIVRRVRMPAATKLVACILAQYGDKAGRNIRPGVPRLGAVCGMGERSIDRHLAALRNMGLIQRLSHGGGRGQKAAEYRLTIPEDLLERLDMLDVDEVTPATATAEVTCGKPSSTSVENPSYSRHSCGAIQSVTGPLLPPLECATPATAVASHQEPPKQTPPTRLERAPHLALVDVDDPESPLVPPPPAWRQRRQPEPPNPDAQEAS